MVDIKIRDQVAAEQNLASADIEKFNSLVEKYESPVESVQEEFWTEYGAMNDGDPVKNAVFAYMMGMVVTDL